MKVIGISCFYHDSAAALISNGEVLAAVQEERFTRIKHDSSFPLQSIQFVLRESQLRLSEIDAIVFYEKPLLKFERILETYLAFAPKGFLSFAKAMPAWLGEKLFQKSILLTWLDQVEPGARIDNKLHFSDHHLSHAASAYFPSPFSEAAVLTLDGVGEWASASAGIGLHRDLKLESEMQFPHSLGLLYSAFTYHAGFKVNSGEYKLMGLAPYGKPIYSEKIKNHLIEIRQDGSFSLNLLYFDFCTGLTMTNEKFDLLFGQRARRLSEPITRFQMDMAASIQAVTEEILLLLSRDLRAKYGVKNLCLAGGVALNCVANGRLLREKIFDDIWIQPAAGDAGGALGAALAFYYSQSREQNRATTTTLAKLQTGSMDSMQGAFLGPNYQEHTIEAELLKCGAHFKKLSLAALLSKTAADLESGCAIGWFQGRAEFGPRALGNRSIIADPRSPKMQSLLNQKIKFRESFRPFAPAILAEDVGNWFDLDRSSPYMLFVANIQSSKSLATTKVTAEPQGFERLKQEQSLVPAVTHVDGSARVQTVHRSTNPRFYDLITEFKKRTGCPMVVNTSFNIRGEPIVGSPTDAYKCFMGTDLDRLIIGDFYLEKNEQATQKNDSYKDRFALD